MLVNGNAITINTTMGEARFVGAAKMLCMRQESSVNLTPFGGKGQYGFVKIIKIELALKLKKLINCIEVFFETS